MNFQLLSLIIFGLLLLGFMFWQRKRIEIQKIIFPFLYFVLYKTKVGLKSMDWFAKKLRLPVDFLSVIGIVAGFLGMAFVLFLVVDSTISLLSSLFHGAVAVPGLMLVLPVEAKGIFYVPLFYWIISIFIVVVVHEYSHGVVARLHNIKLKSSGLAFLCALLPVIPAAFVEPDEKKLVKKPAMVQLAVFAAGPFSNIILAVVVFLIMAFAFVPAGVDVVDINATGPAAIAGVSTGQTIIGIGNTSVESSYNLALALSAMKPGEQTQIRTSAGTHDVVIGSHPINASMSYIGISSKEHVTLFGANPEYGTFLYSIISWIAGLFYWVFALSFGIGLFNLLPLGPIDGGRMFKTLSDRVFGAKKGIAVWKIMSLVCLALVAINILIGFF